MATITSPRAVSPNPSRITSPPPQSAVDTPASSVRTSLDIQSVTGSASNVSTPTVTAPPGQRRNRAALRDYYNIKTKPAATSPGRQSTDSNSTLASSNITLTHSKQDDTGTVLPPQLDDPTFDADKYVSDLLATSTLRDILRAESALVSEIRNYDGERKALVYDNYSKLIKAVGTIVDMQKGMTEPGRNQSGRGIDGIKALQGKLDKLMGVVHEIQGVNNSVVDKSSVDERKQIRIQNRKQELVKWVLEAPNRLAKLKSAGNIKEAEEEWSVIRDLLEKWDGVQGVSDVKAACEGVMGINESEVTDSDGDS